MRSLTFIALLAVVTIAAGCRVVQPATLPAAQVAAPLSSQEFTRLMDGLPTVWGESLPTPEDLRHYTALARRLQNESNDSIERLLGEYSVYASYQDSAAGASAKAFVLLRILFDAPHATESASISPSGFTGRTRALAAGLPAGPSWPIRWVDDHAEIISSLGGYRGGPYRADVAFNWFCSRYSFRALPEAAR